LVSKSAIGEKSGPAAPLDQTSLPSETPNLKQNQCTIRSIQEFPDSEWGGRSEGMASTQLAFVQEQTR
jgi:hypothetical protein